MYDLVDKINEDISNGFNNTSSVNFGIHGIDDYELITTSVPLRYNFDLEYRSWGIKALEFILLTRSFDIEFEVNGEFKMITVDAENIEITHMPGRAFITGDIDVYLNSDLSVADISLDVYYIKE